MTSHYSLRQHPLRQHLADGHGYETRGLTWEELQELHVAEHQPTADENEVAGLGDPPPFGADGGPVPGHVDRPLNRAQGDSTPPGQGPSGGDR